MLTALLTAPLRPSFPDAAPGTGEPQTFQSRIRASSMGGHTGMYEHLNTPSQTGGMHLNGVAAFEEYRESQNHRLIEAQNGLGCKGPW